MTTLIVLVNLKEGVSPEDYESWVRNSYAPVAGSLPSISDWRNHRVGGLLGSDATPPYRYVVTLEVEDTEKLGRERRCSAFWSNWAILRTLRSSSGRDLRRDVAKTASVHGSGISIV